MPKPSAPVVTIDVRIARIESLFESLDPSPFHDRDLDPKALDYIVGWAREYPSDAAFRLRLHLPGPEAARAGAGDVAAAIRANFTYWADSEARDRREQFRMGRRYLAIGLSVLALCLLIRESLPALIGASPLTQFLGEGLAILGWVSNWRPLETLLYDWWPIHRRLTLYRRLAKSEVEIVPAEAG
ncbi:hypothetical protein [Defluviimonas salinarum]|uniref:Holin of 3TMs, for gene-transfer release n=1 Tax=Defluviimonas salinarum TaxID=2992147 RepID=A0ABT3J4M4_9RHOB|nr:hypothetical protein [Defluviimonas salinarum]MCW3782646.1 hypothetical protein [Defluviimonas salinarum]